MGQPVRVNLSMPLMCATPLFISLEDTNGAQTLMEDSLLPSALTIILWSDLRAAMA